MSEFHPFAKYVQIIGKGPKLSCPLTEDEAQDAVRMIINGDVEPLQLGAFLSILRLREEVPAEGAGFVRAMREYFGESNFSNAADLDWPVFAGKNGSSLGFCLRRYCFLRMAFAFACKDRTAIRKTACLPKKPSKPSIYPLLNQ